MNYDYIHPDLWPLAQPIADFIPDPKNARKHSKRNLDAIVNSLKLFKQRKPIVCQRNAEGKIVVRAGNGTLEAAKSMGWTHIAALVVTEDNVQATAYGLADNRTAELAEWDDEIVLENLNILKDEGFRVELLDFEIKEPKEPAPPKEEEFKNMFQVVVECADELEQEEIFLRLQAEGLKCRPLSM